ncbi:efflux RND transporter periplasmic adaptor subunit [Noviherbaspirillum massiliense]|uniref:efflux RND transporter periplasmic adaptor subunit n=1 Tax=Noviherbaspirillum massiliense TaxID=1465823 RepID=UPI003898FF7C
MPKLSPGSKPNSKGKNVLPLLVRLSGCSRPAVRSILLAPALAAVLLGACSKSVEKVEEIRPVRAIEAQAGKAEVLAEFSGEVRPRIESRLGFRVGGKIVARKVDVGTAVRRGQMLMQLDPQDLQLAQAQANAALKAAESNRDLARAELKRYQELREKNFVSQAVLDSKQTAFHAAQSSYEQALAGYRNQSNQAGYTALVADADGVVTAVDAEVGQVVAAGTPVVRVAQAGEKEVAIGIPEDKVDALRRIADVRVRTWANPDEVIQGRVREVSPVADPVTRTYTAKISIPGANPEVKLGMTAYVGFAAKTADPMIRLPLTALYQVQDTTAVWIVDGGAVKAVPVRIGGYAGNDVLIAAGISPGQKIVTAGVNLLRPGQKVKILDDAEAIASAENNARVQSSKGHPAAGSEAVK